MESNQQPTGIHRFYPPGNERQYFIDTMKTHQVENVDFHYVLNTIGIKVRKRDFATSALYSYVMCRMAENVKTNAELIRLHDQYYSGDLLDKIRKVLPKHVPIHVPIRSFAADTNFNFEISVFNKKKMDAFIKRNHNRLLCRVK